MIYSLLETERQERKECWERKESWELKESWERKESWMSEYQGKGGWSHSHSILVSLNFRQFYYIVSSKAERPKYDGG